MQNYIEKEVREEHIRDASRGTLRREDKASESLRVAHGRDGAMVADVASVEMPSSDRLSETEQTPGSTGQGQQVPLHWNRWVGVVSRSLSAMGSGLLQRAMPGSLYPAFTHSDSQRRLQSQWSGLVPSALEGRAGSQGPLLSLAQRLRGKIESSDSG